MRRRRISRRVSYGRRQFSEAVDSPNSWPVFQGALTAYPTPHRFRVPWIFFQNVLYFVQSKAHIMFYESALPVIPWKGGHVMNLGAHSGCSVFDEWAGLLHGEREPSIPSSFSRSYFLSPGQKCNPVIKDVFPVFLASLLLRTPFSQKDRGN